MTWLPYLEVDGDTSASPVWKSRHQNAWRLHMQGGDFSFLFYVTAWRRTLLLCSCYRDSPRLFAPTPNTHCVAMMTQTWAMGDVTFSYPHNCVLALGHQVVIPAGQGGLNSLRSCFLGCPVRWGFGNVCLLWRTSLGVSSKKKIVKVASFTILGDSCFESGVWSVHLLAVLIFKYITFGDRPHGL